MNRSFARRSAVSLCDHYDLEELLERYRPYANYRIECCERSMVVYGPPRGTKAEMRFCMLGKGRWVLSVQDRTGRWYRTGYAGTLEEIVRPISTDPTVWLMPLFMDPPDMRRTSLRTGARGGGKRSGPRKD